MLSWQICLLSLFAKIKFSRKFLYLQYRESKNNGIPTLVSQIGVAKSIICMFNLLSQYKSDNASTPMFYADSSKTLNVKRI